MAPKKDKKGGKEAPAAPTTTQPTVTETEKALWQLETADLNRKLARLRKAVDEYEVRNEELQKAYDKLDEDRADIIAYLKKTLNVKNEENMELKDKVKGLEELRDMENSQFKATVAELEKNFTTMKDQLTSENKLLAGKLNTLEEFRAIRQDLMKKYDEQELAFKNQEMKYKRIIYDTEKKFIIGKDKLKKEMEGKLLDLAQDFQDASELRIAASTHRVLRENIALNNQLDSLLTTQAKIADLNERYKESEREARVAMEAAEEERDKAINKSIVQLKVIDNLTISFQKMEKQKALNERKAFDFDRLETKVQMLLKQNAELMLQVRVLEQNLHANISLQNQSKLELLKVIKEREKFKNVLKASVSCLQAAMKMDQWCILDPTKEVMERKDIFKDILNVILRYRDIDRSESTETIASFSQVYEKGDLGFVPKARASKIRKSATTISSATISKEHAKSKGSLTSGSSESSSGGSLKTIPSMRLVPPPSHVQVVVQDSVPSFAPSSLHSTESEVCEEEDKEDEGLTDIEKKLAASKLEIQKSLLKDLAYSQMAFSSRPKLTEDIETSKPALKPIEDETAVGEKTEGEEVADELRDEVVGEHVEGDENIDKGEFEDNQEGEQPTVEEP